MDFAISPELTAQLHAIRAFVRRELYPLEAIMLSDGFHAILPRLSALREEVKRNGWWLPHLSKAHHGMGLSLMNFGLISEVLGSSILGHYAFNCQAPDAGNMEILAEFGTPAQKEAFLEPLLQGKVRSCFAMTEPEFAGSNPVWMGTTAVLDGDEWVICGHKWFTTAADGANFAVVMAITEQGDEVKPHARASQILVPLETPGYERVRNISIMGEQGEGYMSHSEVRFNDVRVPRENLLGERGAGFAIAQTRLGPGRIHHCMRWLGICERALEMMCRYTSARELAPGKPLSDQQIIQTWMAESRAEIDAARLMVLKTAWRIDHEGTRAARQDISTIKFFVAGVLQRVLDRAVQAHGALGMTDDTPLAFWYRHERAARIYDGPDEVHKLSLARQLVKRYSSPEYDVVPDT